MNARMAALYIAGMAAIFAMAPSARADDADRARIQALEERVERLESLIEKMGLEVPDETGAVEAGKRDEAQNIPDQSGKAEQPAMQPRIYYTPEQKREAGLENRIGRGIGFGGLMEARASYYHYAYDYSPTNSIYVSAGNWAQLSTAQIALTAETGGAASGRLLLEKYDSSVVAQVGYLDFEGDAYRFRVGEFYSPFGRFYSHFMKSTNAQDLAEGRETGVQINSRFSEKFEGWLTAARGDLTNHARNRNMEDFGLGLNYRRKNKAGKGLEIGLSYHSHLDDLGYSSSSVLCTGTKCSISRPSNRLFDVVPGIGSYLFWDAGRWSFNFEYAGQSRKHFDQYRDVDKDGKGDRRQAWDLEIGRTISPRQEFAFRYSGSSETSIPKFVLGAAGNWRTRSGLGFSLEYVYSEYDRAFANQRTRNEATAGVSVEF